MVQISLGSTPFLRHVFAALLLMASYCQAQTLPSETGTVEVYHTGGFATMPLILDSQLKVKIGGGRRLSFTMTAGSHLLESKLGKLNPVLAITVLPGEKTYVILDFKHISFGAIMMMKDPNAAMVLTLEHTNAPPEGKFKDEELKPSEVAAITSLVPYRESAPTLAPTEIPELTKDEIDAAILQGRHTPDPKTIGALLDDIQQQLGSAFAQGQGVSGYSIRVYTAKQWVQLQAAMAQREMRPYSSADVTGDQRKRLLYVIALPSTPDRLTGENMSAASNVQRIVLQVGPSKAVYQPVSELPSTVNLDSTLRSAAYLGLTASFPQPDVTKPFDVVVIGDGYRKTFSLKDKHLAHLK